MSDSKSKDSVEETTEDELTELIEKINNYFSEEKNELPRIKREAEENILRLRELSISHKLE